MPGRPRGDSRERPGSKKHRFSIKIINKCLWRYPRSRSLFRPLCHSLQVKCSLPPTISPISHPLALLCAPLAVCCAVALPLEKISFTTPQKLWTVTGKNIAPLLTALPCTLDFNVAWNAARLEQLAGDARLEFFSPPFGSGSTHEEKTTLKFGVRGAGWCQGVQYFFLCQYSVEGHINIISQ